MLRHNESTMVWQKILELINLHITLHVAHMIILAIILTYNIYGTETPLPALYMD